MRCWYWVSGFCEDIGVDFILGPGSHMKAIHGGKAKNDRIDSFKIASLMRGGNFPLACAIQRKSARLVIYSEKEPNWFAMALT
jgi:hypothetical protein